MVGRNTLANKEKRRLRKKARSIFYKDLQTKLAIPKKFKENYIAIGKESEYLSNRNRPLLSDSEYMYMQLGQKHVCAICKKEETVKNRGKIRCLAIDHCHTTGKVRGLLCSRCNTGLGLFKDNPEYLQNAITYLYNSSVKTV